jgi:High potential iron-sulfur protein
MQKLISRRTLVNYALVAGAFLPALNIGREAAAAEALAPLDPNDPTAKSLGYVSDSSKVDASANPTHKPDQTCANCAQFQGKPGEQQGGCNIFVGKSVAAGGWCKVWAKKPGA